LWQIADQEKGQDKFVLRFIPQGFFLDLGSQHPEQHNNTFLLEQKTGMAY
jgi:hypothetical protein